jgi:hypothetical protein
VSRVLKHEDDLLGPAHGEGGKDHVAAPVDHVVDAVQKLELELVTVRMLPTGVGALDEKVAAGNWAGSVDKARRPVVEVTREEGHLVRDHLEHGRTRYVTSTVGTNRRAHHLDHVAELQGFHGTEGHPDILALEGEHISLNIGDLDAVVPQHLRYLGGETCGVDGSQMSPGRLGYQTRMVQVTVGHEESVDRWGPLGEGRWLGGRETIIEEQAIPC